MSLQGVLSQDPGPSPVLQSLTGRGVWLILTPKQRELVQAHRVVVRPGARGSRRYRIKPECLQASPRTLQSLQSLQSLQAKGVVDECGNLTELGRCAAVWGPNAEGAIW